MGVEGEPPTFAVGNDAGVTVPDPQPALGPPCKVPNDRLAARVGDRLAHMAIPLSRAAVRYVRYERFRLLVWERLISPRLARHRHGFTVRTLFGSRIRGNTDQFGERRIYYCGLFEPNLTRWLEGRLGPGDTFVDVGANIGYFSLLARELGADRVVAIEASPPNFEKLRRNLALNGADNVRAVNVAAYDRPTKVRLYGPESERKVLRGASMTTLVAALGRDLEQEVPAEPLDTILTDEEIATARAVKVDVEGVEWAVAKGMDRLLTEGRDDLEVVVEVHARYLGLQGRRVEEVCEPFLAAGFHAYVLDVDYSGLGHLSPPRSVVAHRMQGPLGREHGGIVFSRRDAEEL